MNIDKFVVSENITILEAMHHLDQNGHGILFICDQNILKAVLSDGDFRRCMLKKIDMNGSVKSIANYHPYMLTIDSHENTMQYMRDKKITAVPIVDKKGRIVRIDFDNGRKVYSPLETELPVVIMAGGKGTRLYPYTNILPKPLIPIGEKTITERIMEQFLQIGCNQFHMIVNYKKNLIKAFFRESEKQWNISFVDEEEFMGTGGGIRLLDGRIQGTFFMTNCDILVEGDYGQMLEYHRENQNIATMVCAKKEIEIPYGIVEVEEKGQAASLREKPSFTFLTNTGLYILESGFIDKIPRNVCVHMPEVLQSCIDSGEKVGVYTIEEEAWTDMGQFEELERMKKKVLERS